MAGPLAGIRVIDFGQYVAGPLAAMLLADHGAEVIRVDPPGGPRWPTPANATWNRGKRGVILDLKRGADHALARQLIGSADVVIENFRPGVMERLDLGPRAMTDAHPRLIYCSLPGFAADDPRASLPAWEGVVAAATGTYRPNPEEPADRPLFTAIPIASHYAAFLGAVSIAMALVARERCGLGQRIEVPLFDATFTAIGAHGLLVDGALAGGRPDDFWGGRFECADGRWVHFSGSTPRFRERLLDATDNGAWRDDGLLDLRRLATEPGLQAELRARLRALFKTRGAWEWEELGGSAGTPLSVCRTTSEWIEAPHARAAQVVWPVPDPSLGTVWQPGAAVRLSAWPGEVPQPAPEPDADRAWVLANLQRAPAAPAAAAEVGPLSSALEGMRVVDLTQVLAGPTAGRTLAEFGADVVKINNPTEEGAGYHTSVHRYHTDVNRGKRTMLLDLKAPEGLDVFYRLVDEADVVLQNARLGVAERLGTGYEQVRARRPDLVYVSVSAYGHAGPWGAWPGYETNAQAACGMQARLGGYGPPLIQPFAVNDYGTGLLAAFGTALALFERARTGRGQRVEAALAFTATLLQSPYLQGYAGKTWDEPRGPTALGWRPLQRLYRTADGWLFLGARAADLPALGRVEGLAGAEWLHGDTLARFLEDRLAGLSAATWADRLTAAGIGAHALAALADLMTDPWVVAHGLAVTREHDCGQRITTIGPGARLSRTPAVPGRPAASPGADAASVLRDVGLEGDYDRLRRQGVIAVERAPAPTP
jgi:crotonobetainyl-CoA:carnitine CoA-transferase CaiB-like acyl-CoA transferase